MKTDYTEDLKWCDQAIHECNDESGKQVFNTSFRNSSLHIQFYGSELVLLPNGKWFMNDTSGA